MITDKFTAVAGSVIGTEHRRTGKNNQDGYRIVANGYVLAAAVSDGCSSSFSSEVGASLLSKFVAEEAVRLMKYECVFKGSEIIDCLERNTIRYIKTILSMHQNPSLILDEIFLATVVGVVMTDYFVTIFTLGDGVYSLNGKTEVINENNMPDYLAYKVFPGDYKVDESRIRLRVREEVYADDVESVIIATDGAAELEKKSDNSIVILGKEEKIGGVNQFVRDEKYAKNAALLQKRLFQLNMEKTQVDWDNKEIRKIPGVLGDDTTIVAIKRNGDAQ